MTTVALLPSTQFGVASGNYNGVSTAFVGNAVPAANYYNGQGSIQTLTFTVGNLTANVTTQATLSDTPGEDWFDVYAFVGNVTTNTTANAAIGNFSWLRVLVSNFTAGNITVATATY